MTQVTYPFFGYAPGNYHFSCCDCTPEQNRAASMAGRCADKRAQRCELHAYKAAYADLERQEGAERIVLAGGFIYGDNFEKTGGDYTFKGEVVGFAKKRSGELRVIGENADGLLFIFNPKQIQRVS